MTALREHIDSYLNERSEFDEHPEHTLQIAMWDASRDIRVHESNEDIERAFIDRLFWDREYELIAKHAHMSKWDRKRLFSESNWKRARKRFLYSLPWSNFWNTKVRKYNVRETGERYRTGDTWVEAFPDRNQPRYGRKRFTYFLRQVRWHWFGR